MQQRDLSDDGEPEAAAGDVGTGDAIEAFEHALAFRRRNARAVVADADYGVAFGFRQFDIDTPAGRGVAQRVVDEIAEQHAQVVGLPDQTERRAGAHAQIDVACFGLCREVRHSLFDQAVQRERFESALARRWLQARHVQQLVDQVGGTTDPAGQLRQRSFAFAIGTGATGDLGLQSDRCKRCAQFMRGIGDEAPLCRHGLIKPYQQVVQGVHQRRDLVRHAARVECVQGHHTALPDFRAHLLQRRQRAADGGADQQAEHQHQHDQRNQQQGRDGRELAREAGRGSRHLDGQAAFPQGENAPFDAVRFDHMQAGRLPGRTGIVERGIEQTVVGRPDLADELAAIVAHIFIVVVLHAMAHHRVGDLFKAVIPHLVERIPGQQIGDDADQQAGQHQRADLP